MSYLRICHFVLSFLQVSTSSETNQSQTTTHKCQISMSPESGSNQSSPLVPQPERSRGFSDESPTNDQSDACEDAEDTPNRASAPPLGGDKEQPLTECELIFIQDDPEASRVTPELTEICDGAADGPGSSTDLVGVPESPQRLREAEPSMISEVRLESGTSDDDGMERLSSLDGDANTDQHLAHLLQDKPTNYILQFVNDQEWMRGRYWEGVSEGESPMNDQDRGTDYREESRGEAIRSEDVSSLSPSDATPETVTSARHFSFEEPALGASSGPPPVDTFCPSRSTSECPKVDRRGTGSPAIDSSDPEGYFDCRQASSDISDPEPDRPRPRDCLHSAGTPERATDRVPLSSESEDYEDAPLVCERPRDGRADGDAAAPPSEPSDGEFTLCEASQPHAACSPDGGPDNCLTRVRRAIDSKQR